MSREDTRSQSLTLILCYESIFLIQEKIFYIIINY